MNLSKLLVFPVLILVLSCQSNEVDIPRERTLLDFDWKFMLGDEMGAEHEIFNDTSWRTLNVPHDWSIEGSYDETNETGIAGAFLPAGIGWYRKVIEIGDLDENDKYFIEFDGVYMNSDVWINGTHLGRRPYGYISFSYDLTPYLRQGQNLLAVRVDNSLVPSGRWYTGSGIYRHVWLTKTSTTYIPQWGTSVKTSNNESGEALVSLDIEFRNENPEEEKFIVRSVLRDKDGMILDKEMSKIEISDRQKINQEFKVQDPNLWSPDNPEMYEIETILTYKEKVIDRYITSLGIRSIEFRGSQGFFLNEESIKFKGLSNHHDAGPVGAAVPDDVLYRRLKLLKDMGCNALRTTHNPFSPEFYTMCDTMGFLVMDEAFDGWWTAKAKHDYGNYFEEWWQKDLSDFIKRDRNHPSVVIWSIGNEVRGFTADQQKEIVEFVRQIDDTRPVTQGRGHSAPYIDVAGFNGHGEFKGELEKYHKNNPDRAIIGTEITHTLQTRGVYRTRTWYRTKDNPAPWEKPEQFKKMEARVYKIPHLAEEEVFSGITKKYQSSYDNSIVRIGIRDDWNRVEKYDYYLGNFRWTGFDYLGESFGWPARTANFGIIDLAGFPKDHYYLYQSLWSSESMVHLLPHWTHPGKEGVEIPVVVYTNCDAAELFLNGKSLGEKKMGEDRQLVWRVPYEKGELKVLAKNSDEVVCEKAYQTAGSAVKVEMVADRKSIHPNRTDVVHIEALISDDNGVMLPDADHLVEFDISGPAKLLGVENGDILDLSPHKVPFRKAFMGKCLLLIQSTGEQGEIEIKASSGNLETASIKIMAEGNTFARNSQDQMLPGVSYYFDAQHGDDNNPGTSEDKAFASLEKANNLLLKAGDQLLFKSGTSYYGQLKPKGGGSMQLPVLIGKFGGEEKPAIHAEGKYLSAIHIYNMSYVELHDLEITNTGAEAQNGRRGVIVEAENFGVASHIVLDNLHIHDVNGSLVKSAGGGSAILWKNHGKELITKFDSLIIQHCHLESCARNGINSRGYTRRDHWHPSTNVIIRHNLLEGIPGDGIVPIGTDGALIEYNVMRDCPDILSHKEAAAGIWPWSADNTIIQFNEVAGHKAKWDGQGFDSDWNCLNTIIQYNYSHDNYGGFLLVCNNGGNYDTPANIGTYNTIIRYNISVNDGIRPYETKRRGPFSPVMHISGPVEETVIHHNIFILPKSFVTDIDKTFIQMDNWGGPWPVKTLLSKNIIEISELAELNYGKSEQTVAVENEFDQSKLDLRQQEKYPDWAADFEEGYDKDFVKKLTEAFFEDNEEMKGKLEEL